MRINYIKNRNIKQNQFVYLKDEEDVLLQQPDLPKAELGLFNYWSEKVRSGVSDDAYITKLVLDFDGGRLREDVINQFKDFEFIIYSSTGNTSEKDKFRIIITLKSPVYAKDLRYNRNLKKFKIYFNGADPASFSIGQYFVVPSKYDKDGNEVVVMKNNGKEFDFYMLFGHCPPTNEMFEKVCNLVKYGKPKMHNYEDQNFTKFNSWLSNQGGLHYMDTFRYILMAKNCNIDFSTAKSMFAENYAGNSEWEKNFDNAWEKLINETF